MVMLAIGVCHRMQTELTEIAALEIVASPRRNLAMILWTWNLIRLRRDTRPDECETRDHDMALFTRKKNNALVGQRVLVSGDSFEWPLTTQSHGHIPPKFYCFVPYASRVKS